MAGTLVAGTLSTGSASVNLSDVTQGTARAWVNFNGTGTVAIRKSFNVSSITDVGSGDYLANFANPMPHDQYAMVAAGALANGQGASMGAWIAEKYTSTTTSTRTVNSCPIHAVNASGSSIVDGISVCAAFYA